MKIDKVSIISGILAGGVTYFVAKKNWKLAIVGALVGGVAGYFINQQINKSSVSKSISAIPSNNNETNQVEEEPPVFDESEEPRFEWNPTINKMMPVGQVNETDSDRVYDINADDLDLDFK